jgi:deoxyribonuclease V
VTIALADAHYDGSGAHAACVVAESWEADSPLEEYVLPIGRVEPYESGLFYRRELPCLVAVLGLLRDPPEVVVIDGYVWLASPERPGLGAHLYEALGRGSAVVGIAKTPFLGAEQSAVVAAVYRGRSLRPLYVTSVGMDLRVAAAYVGRMAGEHRVSELMRRVDRLAREAITLNHGRRQGEAL